MQRRQLPNTTYACLCDKIIKMAPNLTCVSHFNPDTHPHWQFEQFKETFRAELKATVDAERFGTVVGEGDDLAAVVAGMGDSGGVIFLKHGTHTLSSALAVNKPISLVGEGAATILQGAGGADAVIVMAPTSSESPLQHVTVKEMVIQCASGGGSGNNAIGIVMEHVESSFVEHVYFANCRTDVKLTSGSQKNWV